MCKEIDRAGNCTTCGMPPEPLGKFTPYGGYGIPNIKWDDFVKYFKMHSLYKYQEQWIKNYYNLGKIRDDVFENNPLPNNSKVFTEVIKPSKIRGKKADFILIDDLLEKRKDMGEITFEREYLEDPTSNS